MAKVLLAGESWISAAVDHKGFDPFPHTQLEVGCKELLAALRGAGHEVTHMKSHDVAEEFPETLAELNEYDVVIISDVGANSFLLSPKVFDLGEPAPNRLRLLADWVEGGGGLMMAGGYLSFQGFQAKANYAGSPLEAALPVSIHRYDDRVETPEGVAAEVKDAEHEITQGMDTTWPLLLGYQALLPKENTEVLVTVGEDPLLVVGDHGEGRSIAYASDVSPHWAPRSFMEWEGYQTLFDRCVRWLAKED